MSDVSNGSEIDRWAKTFIETHKNPIKKLELSGTKFFIPTETEEENELVNKSLNFLVNAFKSQRAERRCARSAANWLPDQKLVEITKGGGIMNSFGFANKSGRFLYPEEAIFLLETNRLELFWNDVPISIQQAYEVILNESRCNLSQYLIYKKLVHQGFRLIRTDHIEKDYKTDEPKRKKRKFSENKQCTRLQNDLQLGLIKAELPSLKNTLPSTITTGDLSFNKSKMYTNEALDKANDIFKKLRESGPKQLEMERSQTSDYKIFLSNNSDRSNPDFNLYISDSKCINPSLGFLNDKTVVGYIASEFSGYFRYGCVILPNL